MDIFRKMLRETKTQYIASGILQLIARQFRAELPVLIPALVREDPSWITQGTVLDFLHRHRQDLLTPFLGQRAYRGRFSTGRTRHVLPLTSGFWRWTPTQQASFGGYIAETRIALILVQRGYRHRVRKRILIIGLQQ